MKHAVNFGLWQVLQVWGRSRRLFSESEIVANADELTPATPPLFRFAAIADTGTGDRSQYAVARAMARYHKQHPFDLVLLAGDNIYRNGEIEKINTVFERPYKPLLRRGVKFYACLGNHDVRTENGDRQIKYPHFNMAGRYYTFRRDAVQFFAIETMNEADWNSQLTWLRSELRNSDAPWKIVFGHHPLYSSGQYGVNKSRIKKLKPFFKKYGVQLYINGHEHDYERTRPIDGTTYLICGAGAKSRPVGRSEWTEYATECLSFAVNEVYGDRIVISGIDKKGRVFDRGVIWQ
ncbi:MAG: metallophosphoesterase [Limnospira sp.]